jgi:hypothetical protein
MRTIFRASVIEVAFAELAFSPSVCPWMARQLVALQLDNFLADYHVQIEEVLSELIENAHFLSAGKVDLNTALDSLQALSKLLDSLQLAYRFGGPACDLSTSIKALQKSLELPFRIA